MVTNRERWEAAFGASRRRDVSFTTMSGIPLEAVYGPDDGEFPGEYPYTRGPYASMYRSKLWTMRMFAGFGTAEDTNWRFKEIIKAGGDPDYDGISGPHDFNGNGEPLKGSYAVLTFGADNRISSDEVLVEAESPASSIVDPSRR